MPHKFTVQVLDFQNRLIRKRQPADMTQYDPKKYWNERVHPNTKEDPGISGQQAEYIQQYIANASTLLEIGPGVGRLFPLYKNIPHVQTIDISTNYTDRLQKEAEKQCVSVKENFLSDPLDKFPFPDQSFDAGIASYVFLHIPFENIRHTMSEMARTCKKVAIITGVSKEWPKTEAERKPTSHCFNHDYEALCKEINCKVVSKDHITNTAFGLVYQLDDKH